MCTKLSLRERKIYAIEEKLQNSMPTVVWAAGLFHYGFWVFFPRYFGHDLVADFMQKPSPLPTADGDLVVSLRTNISWPDVLNSINCHRQTTSTTVDCKDTPVISCDIPYRCNFNQNSHVCVGWHIAAPQPSVVTGWRNGDVAGDEQGCHPKDLLALKISKAYEQVKPLLPHLIFANVGHYQSVSIDRIKLFATLPTPLLQ